MMQRQQLLLQQLGIQQWILPQQNCVPAQHKILWREDDDAIMPSPIVTPQPINSALANLKSVVKPEPIVQEDVVLVSEEAEQVVEPVVYKQEIHFDMHVLVHASFSLIAAVSTPQQQQLLQNIATACHGSLQQLQWPLQYSDWISHDDLVEYYLKGYFKHFNQQQVMSLGELPDGMRDYFSHAQICASLAQMLEKTRFKGELWGILYPLVYGE